VAGTILIIDDHEDTRRIYGEILRYSGFGVLEAGDGPAGLQLLVEHLPALVLLDVSLPGTSGYDVLAEIRTDARTRTTAVVCVSANAFPHNVERAYALGCDLYLIKPLPPAELLDHVRAVLRGRSHSADLVDVT
jgi:DNA-binding response OmpR family regulator